jgi:type IV pilus assembly protein PilB
MDVSRHVMKSSPPRKRLGESLVSSGLIDEKTLQKALDIQKIQKKRLGRILIEMGVADDQTIAKTLAIQLRIPIIHLSEMDIPKEIVSLVPAELVENHLIMPVKETKEGFLLVAMVNPLDLNAVDDLRFVTQKRISIAIAPEDDILRAIEKYYPKKDLERDLNSGPALDEGVEIIQRKEKEEKELTDVQDILDLTERPPVVRLTNAVIADAIKMKASDIHIEPQKNEMVIRYRVDGMMKEIMKADKHIHASLVSRIKVVSNMDISIRRKPQDGKSQIKYNDKIYDLRISTIPATYGENVTIRILNPDTAKIKIEDLGISGRALDDFIDCLDKPQGIILVTGPTGSGKSSTLYACLNRLNNPTVNIITVEDPVEYDIKGVNQVQINPAAGITFAAGLRSILRQDPDIVMVGEIRDNETASIACQAAQTGHLVLSTLHTNDAPSTITRLMDLGMEPFLIASSLVAIIGQRLVRKICDNCKAPNPLGPRIMNRLKPLARSNKDVVFWKGAGCEACNYSGYSGRLGIFEVLTITPAVRDAISGKISTDGIRKIAEGEGYQPMSMDGIVKAVQGLTTIEEIFRVAPPEFSGAPEEKIVQPAAPERTAFEEEPAEVMSSSLSMARPHKMLVADDNEIMVKVISNILENEGYLVSVAGNGLEAYKRALQEKPDLIITDYLMPEMDGVTLIKKLRSQLATRYIPIIMLTAKDAEDAEAEVFNAGADEYLTKPVNPKKFLVRINKLLKKGGSGQG